MFTDTGRDFSPIFLIMCIIVGAGSAFALHAGEFAKGSAPFVLLVAGVVIGGISAVGMALAMIFKD